MSRRTALEEGREYLRRGAKRYRGLRLNNVGSRYPPPQRAGEHVLCFFFYRGATAGCDARTRARSTGKALAHRGARAGEARWTEHCTAETRQTGRESVGEERRTSQQERGICDFIGGRALLVSQASRSHEPGSAFPGCFASSCFSVRLCAACTSSSAPQRRENSRRPACFSPPGRRRACRYVAIVCRQILHGRLHDTT